MACGVVAGPLFLVAAFVQAFARTGFDLRRHPFSMLSLGELGWVQITNFVVVGLLFIACAAGMRQVLRGHPGGSWGPVLVGVFGVAQVAGGVFVADPALGFPAGTGDGPPASLSWHGIMHGLAFAVGMLALVAAFAVFARVLAAAGDRLRARFSLAAGVVFVVLGGTGAGVGDWRFVAVAIAVGWSWAAWVAHRLRSPGPSGRPGRR
nr:DUF998 domain-containing protein [Pseudonocardia sp. C8]